MKWRILPLFISLCLLLSGCMADSENSASESSSVYIQNKGSDTIVNLALAWAERYQTLRPDVRLSVTGGGSGTGITSLINGTVDIANASRAIKSEEIEAAKANGIEPVEHVIARDAIAVIVNPQNPVDKLTLDQISRIYRGEITNWQEVGGEDRPIVRLSRETNSGTHVYFLEAVVRLGNSNDKTIFSPLTLLLPSSEGIISEVSSNPNAIGYDGLGYVTDEVKMIAVSPGKDQPYVLPSIQSVNDLTYPIARDLYMYSRQDSSQAVLDFLDWILSAEAQQIVADLGFVPVHTAQ
jgi:phosphate transport system substrate-binding protein